MPFFGGFALQLATRPAVESSIRPKLICEETKRSKGEMEKERARNGRERNGREQEKAGTPRCLSTACQAGCLINLNLIGLLVLSGGPEDELETSL